MRAHFLSGNGLTLLKGGNEYFTSLIAAIDNARVEVRLETYIFFADTSGERVAAALSRAALRGVHVHVVVDGFGSPNFMETLGDALIADGAEVLVYRPEIARFRFRRHRLRRLHRKLACVDACVAFVGGINIIDDNTPGQTPPRLDYAVRIEGKLLSPIHQTMCRVWGLLRWANLGRRYEDPLPPAACVGNAGNVLAALVIRDNLRHRRDIEKVYLSAFAHAKQEIILANAYFLPGRRFRTALMAAATRGVKVRLLLQGLVEYRLLHYATQTLYGQLSAAGIEIYEYQQSFLHAKVAVIDKNWATVGSSNIDPFSLLLAREANIIVQDTNFSSELYANLDSAIENGARRVEQAKLPPYRRVLHWVAYGLVRLMVGLTGYGRLM